MKKRRVERLAGRVKEEEKKKRRKKKKGETSEHCAYRESLEERRRIAIKDGENRVES